MTTPTKTKVILVLSGKGGVGKSTVSASIALSLAYAGHRVGVLDIDLTGPSIPRILGVVDHRVHQGSKGWIPVHVPLPTTTTGHISCMSIGFLLQSPNDAVIWRGPKKTAMIRQFLQDVDWGTGMDYLVVDTPPGTGDEHIAVVEQIRDGWAVDGAVLVTTPQDVAVADVRKELSFCRKVGLPVFGVIENMSGYVCPHCSECTNLFSKGGGQQLAVDNGIPFLGYVPIDPTLVASMETSSASKKEIEAGMVVDPEKVVAGYVAGFPVSGIFGVMNEITATVLQQIQ